jgi:hypothetical protein
MWWLALWLWLRTLYSAGQPIATAIYSVGFVMAVGIAIIINHLEEGVVVGLKKAKS